jgi:hypothetical protein
MHQQKLLQKKWHNANQLYVPLSILKFCGDKSLNLKKYLRLYERYNPQTTIPQIYRYSYIIYCNQSWSLCPGRKAAGDWDNSLCIK